MLRLNSSSLLKGKQVYYSLYGTISCLARFYFAKLAGIVDKQLLLEIKSQVEVGVFWCLS